MVTISIETHGGHPVKNAWKMNNIVKKKWYTMYAKTPEIKAEWMAAFEYERQRVKEDQESGVFIELLNVFIIPIHVSIYTSHTCIPYRHPIYTSHTRTYTHTHASHIHIPYTHIHTYTHTTSAITFLHWCCSGYEIPLRLKKAAFEGALTVGKKKKASKG